MPGSQDVSTGADRGSAAAGALALFAVLAVLVGVVVLFFPLFQHLAYGVLVVEPSVWWWTLVGVVLAGVAARTGHPDTAAAILVIALVMALFVGPMLGSVYTKEALADDMQANAATPDGLPETSTEHVRVLPRGVADRYATSSFQKPTHSLGESDIAYHDGRYTWSRPVAPEALGHVFRGNQEGAAFTDMERTEKHVDITDDSFECGYGQMWFDDINWKLMTSKPFVQHNSNTGFVAAHDGEPYIARSYTTHEWHFGGPIPQPYTVPKHSGVLVTDTDCNVDDVSAAEAADDPRLDGQNYYPYSLANLRVRAMQYEVGLWHKWFDRTGLPAMADLPSNAGNNWPVTVPIDGDDGPELAYFTATEPMGGGDGVFKVFVFDGQTGDAQVVTYDNTQIGPQRAADFVRKENPRVNWATGESGTMQVTEPVPISQNGTLYWHVKVVPTDNTGISYTAFVNGETGTVTRVDGNDQIYAFVNQEVAEDLPTANETDDQGPTRTIAVIRDGTVVRTIEVPANATIRIDPSG